MPPLTPRPIAPHARTHPRSLLHAAGLALLNNLAQLVKALAGGGSASEVTPVLVSLFSVANCGGRMALGFFPERLLHARGTPRVLFLPAVSALMAGACAALAFARVPHLYPLSALAGFSFGGFIIIIYMGWGWWRWLLPSAC